MSCPKESNMKTTITYLSALAVLGTAMLVGIGGVNAAPAPSATVVLVCDRNVDSDLHVDLLQGDIFSNTIVGSSDLSCGPDSVSGDTRERVRVPVSGSYDAVSYSQTVQDANGSGGCGGRSTVPAKVSCEIGTTGRGATFTVR
jgi:hypothetical protein